MTEQRLVEMGEHAVKKAYARWAPIYDFTFGIIADSGRKRAVRHINSLPPGRVLEVGVGTGISLPSYKPEHRITGIDLSPEMLAKARERVRKARLENVEAILEMDAADMSAFEDDSFDVVVAMYVMTVVPDPVKVMKELERVCRTGGEVIVVNHFSQEKGLRGTLEKGMARFAEDLGWRPEFPKDTILVCDRLKLVDEEQLKPFGLFTMMRFKKMTCAPEQDVATLSSRVAAQ
ncbi:class I SAM-dependent methyltransferase [Thermopetrobacter sp. TC1]|uniref:class I SAM-dependent methyltransferase n=1 Tax=Thermopetrobacter sp. TC1 TaxID=1495045 RepID=UPI001E2A9FBE|nr:class I SAM-dependent methyltransferase [Thermopetrobacter sp. TC1]